MRTPTPPRQIFACFARLGHAVSEFADGFNGTCTQTSLENCVAAVENRAPSQAKMVAYARAMQHLQDTSGNPLAAENGATTLAHIAWFAQHVLGKAIAVQWNYQEPLQEDWLDLLRTNAGVQPILMQVAHGANLIDAETKVRPEAAARGLRYHAIAIIGKQADGYICCDGDSPQVTQRFQIYDRATLTAAVPCGLLMLAMPTSRPVPAPPKPLPPPVNPAQNISEKYKAALTQIQSVATAALKG